MISVPDNNSFSLSDVVSVTGGTSLQAAFTNSIDEFFDASYKGSKDRLSNFRNYTVYQVGDSYLGGIIAYIYQSGDPGYVSGEFHGIIAESSDDATLRAWDTGTNVLTEVTSINLGDGEINTTTIVTDQGAGTYSAKAAYDYSDGTYSDWWLPTSGELSKMWLNRSAIGGFNNTANYWTSSEYSLTNAMRCYWGDGSIASTPKSSTALGRWIRYF